MKKLLFTFLFITSISFFSQENNTIKKKYEEIPFRIIEDAPIYKGCESLPKEQHKKCMSNKLRMHVSKNFNNDVIRCLEKETVYNKELGEKEEKCISLPKGKKKLYLQFKIGKTGEVENITARAPHQKLQEEAIRIAKLIPKMIPGKQKGKPVTVSYTLPITFFVD